MTDTSAPTAGLIIIGNEILTGKVQDENSFFLARELRELGVSLSRISVIPDDIEIIGREARRFSENYDHVFTSGGVGPTHDDLTMSGIAFGFGVRLGRNQALVSSFTKRYGERLNEAVLKMADIPAGAEVIEFDDGRFPLVCFRNIYIFPGIPRYLREKFTLIRERFRAANILLRRLFLCVEESDIAESLNRIVESSPAVAIGSYPIMDNPDHRLIITFESRDRAAFEQAVSAAQELLPHGCIVRTE